MTNNDDMAEMDHSTMDQDSMNMSEEDEMSVASATVSGVVNSVMVAHRMVNISRGPIDKWQREAADVDFIVAEGVDIGLFIQGASLEFTFEIRGGVFLIIEASETNIKTVSSSVFESKLEPMTGKIVAGDQQ
jgi:Cu(I)/Ag(I) efflux system membrane fusion protein